MELVEEQNWESGKITAHLEHFSKYILVNKTIYTQAWNYTFIQEENDKEFSGLDIAFVIDDSGSMTSNDRSTVRARVTRDFISKLTDNDRAAIVSFTNSSTTLCNFTSDKTTLTNATKKLYSSGGTNLSSGISRAINLFDSLGEDDTRLKYIVMLTDGQGSYNTYYSTQALNKNIIISTVGLGNSVSSSVLSTMAEATGGQYYHVNKAEELYYIFDTIAEKADYYKDTDGDGINDYFEKEMAAGHLVLGNGVPVTSVSYLNDDSDHDGLTDGKEVLVSKYSSYVYVVMKSNPGVVDTDGDGIDDKDDKFPLIPNESDLLIHQTKSYEGLKKKTSLEENIVADDLTFNDRSYTQIVSDCKLVGLVAGITPEFMMWAEFTDLFLLGFKDFDWDLEVTLIDMLDEFQYRSSNTGISVEVDDSYNSSYYNRYSDTTLTDRAENYDDFDNYLNDVKDIVINELKANNGNLSALASTGASTGLVSDDINGSLSYPVFSLKKSTGLVLAIHDFQGHNITIENYVFDGTNFLGTLKFHFYDHFGLDNDDYQWAPGFCDWYTLQHYDRFDGKYCPYITVIDTSLDFTGFVN